MYPHEVEKLLHQRPAVRAAAVVGLAHDTLGEAVGTAIVMQPDADVRTDAIQAYVKARVAAYKYPRRIWVVDELPFGPTGKVQRRDIRPPGQQECASH